MRLPSLPEGRVGGRHHGPLGRMASGTVSASRRRIEPCMRFSRTRLTDIVDRWQTQAWVSPFR